MNHVGSIFFRILDIFAHFILLNFLWLLCSIPIVTIFPATTALFAVTKKWLHNGIGVGVIRPFLKALQENFKKGFIIGIVWGILALILYVDFVILLQEEFTGKFILLVLCIFFLIIYVFTSIYIFDVIISQSYSVFHTIKVALLLSVQNIIHTIFCIVIIIVYTYITLQLFILSIVFGSILAFTISFVLKKVDNKLHSL